jgi:hypothetical protein
LRNKQLALREQKLSKRHCSLPQPQSKYLGQLKNSLLPAIALLMAGIVSDQLVPKFTEG